jgi:hypothetical protein
MVDQTIKTTNFIAAGPRYHWQGRSLIIIATTIQPKTGRASCKTGCAAWQSNAPLKANDEALRAPKAVPLPPSAVHLGLDRPLAYTHSSPHAQLTRCPTPRRYRCTCGQGARGGAMMSEYACESGAGEEATRAPCIGFYILKSCPSHTRAGGLPAVGSIGCLGGGQAQKMRPRP